MQNWNNLEYHVFDPGARGYQFKLMGIDLIDCPDKVSKKFNDHFMDLGKTLDIISVPNEEEKLPSYYIPDMKGMLKFSWQDRYELLLESLTKANEKKEESALFF